MIASLGLQRCQRRPARCRAGLETDRWRGGQRATVSQGCERLSASSRAASALPTIGKPLLDCFTLRQPVSALRSPQPGAAAGSPNTGLIAFYTSNRCAALKAKGLLSGATLLTQADGDPSRAAQLRLGRRARPLPRLAPRPGDPLHRGHLPEHPRALQCRRQRLRLQLRHGRSGGRDTRQRDRHQCGRTGEHLCQRQRRTAAAGDQPGLQRCQRRQTGTSWPFRRPPDWPMAPSTAPCVPAHSHRHRPGERAALTGTLAAQSGRVRKSCGSPGDRRPGRQACGDRVRALRHPDPGQPGLSTSGASRKTDRQQRQLRYCRVTNAQHFDAFIDQRSPAGLRQQPGAACGTSTGPWT